MIRRPRLAGAAALLASAALFASAALIAPVGPLVAPSGAAGRLAADSVAIVVESVNPVAPADSTTARPLTVVLSVTNRTDRQLDGIRIEGQRAEPISTQSALDADLVQRSRPTGSIVEIRPTHPVTVDLPAGATQQVAFATTSGIPADAGLCVCHRAAVYPLFFSAHAGGPGGVDQQLGVASTFVPVFHPRPAPVRVSWVWPLIDQPHRLGDGNVFTDDLLTSSVGPDGRLSRVLAVAEAAGRAQVPLTLLIDPELLDELAVMAGGNYRISTGTGRTTRGAGRDVAQAWLDRLHAVLADDPVRVQLTPYGDPDVEALTQRGLPWATALPAAMRARVVPLLAGWAADSSLAWPAGGAVSSNTLHSLVASGVSTVLLNSTDVSPRPSAAAVHPGLARLSVSGQDVAVGLLNPALQKYIARATTLGGAGLSVLPELVAELAVRATQEPDAEHIAVLAPPRYVDPSVDDAAAVIEATSRSTFAEPVALNDAVGGSLVPTARSRLAPTPATAAVLPPVNVDAAAQVAREAPAVRSLLTTGKPPSIGTAARALLNGLPGQAQRVASSAWGRPDTADTAGNFAISVTTELNNLTHGVKIVHNASGSYTLASNNSPLPITVENDLDYPVRVTVRVDAANGLPGFTARPNGTEVEAHQKATIRLSTNIDPRRRIKVDATLWTPNGVQLGEPVPLTVRSTALGTVGVVITVLAGAVLVLALLIRFGRQLRRRQPRERAPRGPRWDPDAPNAPADPAVLAARGEAPR